MIRVLIADDSPVALDGLKALLEWEPEIEVIGEAADGLEAVSLAQEALPDIILMDAQMPRLDGIEATRRVKELRPEIGVIFLAVHDFQVSAALDAGADECLMKDSGRRQLVETVARLRRHC